ncbi:MAG TPA: DUF222 domain-containing protein, partial [Mycobacterium sp.]
MFEGELPGASVLAGVDDAALVDAITGWARLEAAAVASRLAAIAELTDRRCRSELATKREHWACDAWDSAAAEVAAAQSLSHRAASTLMHQGLALRHRLPRVGALLATGSISGRIATLVAWRTHLVDDAEALAAIDSELAAAANKWGPLSAAKLEAKVDALVERHDPDAVLQYRAASRGRDVRLGHQDDTTGTSSLWGRLYATDAELLERRLNAMARAVCPDDPRTLGERRSEAMGVIAAGGDVLPCTCGRAECPTAGPDARGSAIVIHVLTDMNPREAAEPTPTDDGSGPTGTAAQPPASTCPATTAVIAGGDVVPAPLVAELRRMGAVMRPVPNPASLGAEPGYRPSARLERLVRSRDLTCCFPGCDHPAEYCDVDHTIPDGAGGLTHPGNLKCLCRKHHLLKTFWTGKSGWTDRQESDGTVIWTSPTGHEYAKPPGSRIHFPEWNTTTPTPASPPAPASPPPADRGVTMPKRRRTRASAWAARIQRERECN